MSSHVEDHREALKRKLGIYEQEKTQTSFDNDPLSAKDRLNEIIKRIDIWNGGSSSRVELGRNKLRKLIGWKDSDETSFGYKLLEELLIAHEELVEEDNDNKPEKNIALAKLPNDNDLAVKIKAQFKSGKVSVNEVCQTILDISQRLKWNYVDPNTDPRRTLRTPPENVLEFLNDYKDGRDGEEIWYRDLNENQQILLLFIGEAFIRWYRLPPTQDLIEEINND